MSDLLPALAALDAALDEVVVADGVLALEDGTTWDATLPDQWHAAGRAYLDAWDRVLVAIVSG